MCISALLICSAYVLSHVAIGREALCPHKFLVGCLQQLSSVTDPEAATSEYNLVENIHVCLCTSHPPCLLSLSAHLKGCLRNCESA